MSVISSVEKRWVTRIQRSCSCSLRACSGFGSGSGASFFSSQSFRASASVDGAPAGAWPDAPRRDCGPRPGLLLDCRVKVTTPATGSSTVTSAGTLSGQRTISGTRIPMALYGVERSLAEMVGQVSAPFRTVDVWIVARLQIRPRPTRAPRAVPSNVHFEALLLGIRFRRIAEMPLTDKSRGIAGLLQTLGNRQLAERKRRTVLWRDHLTVLRLSSRPALHGVNGVVWIVLPTQ